MANGARLGTTILNQMVAVYVLHAFQKKSKTGIATPKSELDLVKQRLLDAGRDYRGRQN